MNENNSSGGENLPAQSVNAPTMSSVEIAELCGTRHNQIVETILRLIEKGVLRESRKTPRRVQPTGGGRPTEVYDLSKRDTLVVVSGYDDELRAKIIDRWIEIETAKSQPHALSTDLRETRLIFGEAARMARIAGLKGNAQILSAAMATKKLTGTDPLEIVGRTHLPAPTNDQMVNPTTIGQQLGGISAMAVNKLLMDTGHQTKFRDQARDWRYQPTPKGEAAGARMMDTGKQQGGRMIQQLMWPISIVDVLRPLADGRAA